MAVKAEFQADFKSFLFGVEQADEKLKTFGKTSEKTAAASKQWAQAFGAADSALQQAGVNVGGASRALDELNNAAGKTVTQLGAVATGSLVVGTAMAGWEFGRAIAGWLGTDEAIGKATASLLGYADVAAETAGAQQDTINSAIAKGGIGIRTYADAVAYLNKWNKDYIKDAKDAAVATDRHAEAMIELNSAGAGWQGTLNTLSGSVVEAIKYYLDAGVAQGTLATAYGVTATQVKAVADAMKAAEATDKAFLERLKAEADEAEQVRQVLERLTNDGIEKTNQANERAIRILTDKTDTVKEAIIAAGNYTDVQLKAALKSDEETQAFWKARDAVNAKAAAVEDATKKTGAYMNQLHMLLDDPKISQFFGFNAQGAAAATLYGGGQSGITPEMAAAMAAGQFINTAGVGAVHNTFNVNGTAQDVARTISSEIMRTMKAGGKMVSS